MRAGRCSEAERDRIEEQVGAFVRTCTDNIARLEASVAAEPALNAHVVAHRHGAVRDLPGQHHVRLDTTHGTPRHARKGPPQKKGHVQKQGHHLGEALLRYQLLGQLCILSRAFGHLKTCKDHALVNAIARAVQALILSERLHAVGSAFDRCRSLRYQQLLQQQRRRRALPEALVRVCHGALAVCCCTGTAFPVRVAHFFRSRAAWRLTSTAAQPMLPRLAAQQ